MSTQGPPRSREPQGHDTRASYSQIFPLIRIRRDFLQKGFLVPALVTVAAVVGLFATIGQPLEYFTLLGLYLAIASYYAVSLLCGHAKPAWLAIAVGLAVVVLLLTPLGAPYFFIFRFLLPGSPPADPAQVSLMMLFTTMFFGAGLCEELLKATPVFLCWWLASKKLQGRWRDRLAVSQPLDGIVLGAAAGAAFALVETLLDYVPRIASQTAAQGGEGVGYLIGLQLLIPRLLGNISGHVAYSAYFGYFIGLAALFPRDRWRIISIGWITAALLHAVWNTLAADSIIVSIFIGVLSYAFMMSAILKARRLSPDRTSALATKLISSVIIPHADDSSAATALVAAGQSVSSPPSNKATAPMHLSFGDQSIALWEGRRLGPSDISGLEPDFDPSLVAMVVRSPLDPAMLGLQNYSRQRWTAVAQDGGVTEVPNGRSVRLASGTRINFGHGIPDALIL